MYPFFSEKLMESHSFSGIPSNIGLYVSPENLSGWQSATLTNYGFPAGVVAIAIPHTKKWIRVA